MIYKVVTKEGDVHYYSGTSYKDAEMKAKEDGLSIAMIVVQKPCGE